MAPTATAAAEQLETAQRLRALFGRLSRALRPTETGSAKNLTPTRVSVLLTTDRHGPIRLSEIAAQEGLNPTLLSRTVAALVEDGLLRRTADAEDRRSAWVAATAEGHEVAEGVRHDRTDAVQQVLGALTPQDRETITAALPALERFALLLREVRS